jgi:hypothetical protein
MNRRAKKYIQDNTLDLNKNERMDTTGYVSLAVSIGKAYGALAIVEDDMIEKAIDSYIDTCGNRIYGVCSTIRSRHPFGEGGYSHGYCLGRDCLLVKEFIEKLNEDEK